MEGWNEDWLHQFNQQMTGKIVESMVGLNIITSEWENNKKRKGKKIVNAPLKIKSRENGYGKTSL